MTYHLEIRDARGENFLADLHNYAQKVWPRMTEFGIVIGLLVGQKHISMGQPRPHPKGAWPQHPSPNKNWATDAQTVHVERGNLVRTRLGRSVFLDVSMPRLKGETPQRPPIFWTPHTDAKTVWPTATSKSGIFYR